MGRKARRRQSAERPFTPSVNSHVKIDGAPKQQYRTETEAKQAAQAAWSRDGVDLQPYRCPVCFQWHIGGRRDDDRGLWSRS